MGMQRILCKQVVWCEELSWDKDRKMGGGQRDCASGMTAEMRKKPRHGHG